MKFFFSAFSTISQGWFRKKSATIQLFNNAVSEALSRIAAIFISPPGTVNVY
jgi:hypothetical protein